MISITSIIIALTIILLPSQESSSLSPLSSTSSSSSISSLHGFLSLLLQGDAPVQLDQLLRAEKPLSPCSWASLPPRPIAGSHRVQYFDHNTSFLTSLTSSSTSLFQSSSSSSSYRTSEWSSWRRVRAILASTVFSTSCRATRPQVGSTILFLVPLPRRRKGRAVEWQ